MEVFLVLAVVGTIAGIALYQAHLAERRRRERLHALAMDLGWDFDPSGDSQHHHRHGHFSAFGRGSSRRAYNTLRGTVELAGRPCRVKMGDYRYTVQQGKNRKTRHLSYLIADLPFAGVPGLAVRREWIFDQVAAAFGFDDIDFESAEFSDRFHVRSPNKRFAFDVFHPRMMEFFLTAAPPTIEMAADECCLTDGKRRWDPDGFRRHVWWVKEFIGLWPEHLTSRLARAHRVRLEDLP